MLNSRRKTISVLFFVLSAITLYVKRWWFRTEWHFTFLPIVINNETYRGDLIIACMISLLIVVIMIGFVNKKRKKRNAIYIILAPIMPILSTLMVEVSIDTYSGFLSQIGTERFFMNFLIMAFVYVVVFMLLNSLKYTVVITSGIITLFSIVNYYVESFRGKPVYPADIFSVKTAMEVSTKYDWGLNASVITVILVEAAVLVVWKNCDIRILQKLRIVSCLIAGLMLIGINAFLDDVYPMQIGKWGNGYLLDFSYVLKHLSAEKPENYSREKVEKIADEYVKDNSEVTSYEDADLPDNIIVIMNESWADLSVLGEMETSENVFSFYDSLKENVVKGNLYVSVFAGGTANSEIEFLTGNSVASMPENAIAFQLYVEDGIPNIVSMFSDLGYHTVSYHPEIEVNYNRNNVYPALGFDECLWRDSFKDNEFIREFVSDSSDFRHLIQIYEEKQEKRLFLYNVTIQNHGDYLDYPDFQNTVTIKSNKSEYKEECQYLSLIRLTDMALEELIDYFSNVDEKTAVIMFGDHQPQLSEKFYTEAGYIKSDDIYDAKYITKFIIWTNYDIQERYVEKISLNYLSSLFMETIGLELNGYASFLHNLWSEFPVISHTGCIDKNGKLSLYEPEVLQGGMIRNYSYLQYNYLYDAGGRIKNFFWIM